MNKKETEEHIGVAQSFLEDLEALLRKYDVEAVNSKTGKKYDRQADIYVEIPHDIPGDDIFVQVDLPCPDGSWVHVELADRPYDEMLKEGGETK